MEPTPLSLVARRPAFSGDVSPRTLLPELRFEAGLQAWEQRGEAGALAQLSTQTLLSRQTLWSLGCEVEDQFQDFARQGGRAAGLHWVGVDRAQLVRAIVSARAQTPVSLRDIQKLSAAFYNLKPSYGFVQGRVREAEERAGELMATVDLSQATWVSLDELFVGGKPILVGVDLHSGYLFCQKLCPSRSAEDWVGALKAPTERGLDPEGVVADRGKGLLSGSQKMWPKAQQRGDIFHVKHAIYKEIHHLERRAYSALETAEKAERRRMNTRADDCPYSLGQNARRADENAERAMHAHDLTLEVGRLIFELLEPIDLFDGHLRSSREAAEAITTAAETLKAPKLPRRCRKLATYLINVAESACAYIDALVLAVQSVSEVETELRAAQLLVWLWRLDQEMARPSNHFRLHLLRALRRSVVLALSRIDLEEGRLPSLLNDTVSLLKEPNRASSLVEAINSVLRPWLQAHKHVTQGALDLFAARWNFCPREAGKLKGSCPYTRLTGIPVHDWLSLLGAPPSRQWN